MNFASSLLQYIQYKCFYVNVYWIPFFLLFKKSHIAALLMVTWSVSIICVWSLSHVFNIYASKIMEKLQETTANAGRLTKIQKLSQWHWVCNCIFLLKLHGEREDGSWGGGLYDCSRITFLHKNSQTLNWKDQRTACPATLFHSLCLKCGHFIFLLQSSEPVVR